VIRLLVAVVALVSLSGCGAGMAARGIYQAPDSNLAEIKSIYVVRLAADDRKINELIVTDLTKRGYKAWTEQNAMPNVQADAVIAYKDRWFWDMTMYMYELTVYIKDTNAERILGAGKSVRMTLARQSPEFMVAEVLDAILPKK